MMILTKVTIRQRPKKSELSGWQISTHKNFPDEVRKSFLRAKIAQIVFATKSAQIVFATKKYKIANLMSKSICSFIKTIWKLSRQSGNFTDNLETFQTIWKLSRWSRNFPAQFQRLCAQNFQTHKNFPDGNATMPRWFLGLCHQNINVFSRNPLRQDM